MSRGTGRTTVGDRHRARGAGGRAAAGADVPVLPRFVPVLRGRRDPAVGVTVYVVSTRRELFLESSVGGLGTEVLQLPSDRRLLGLLTAAPHGVDPLQRRTGAGTEWCGPV